MLLSHGRLPGGGDPGAGLVGAGPRPRSPWADAPLPLQEAWKHAIEKAKHMPDPWAEFHLEDIASECATRHRSAPGCGVARPRGLGSGAALLRETASPAGHGEGGPSDPSGSGSCWKAEGGRAFSGRVKSKPKPRHHRERVRAQRPVTAVRGPPARLCPAPHLLWHREAWAGGVPSPGAP